MRYNRLHSGPELYRDFGRNLDLKSKAMFVERITTSSRMSRFDPGGTFHR